MRVAGGRVLRVSVYVVAAVLLVWFAKGVEWRSAWAAVRQAEPLPLVLAAVLNLVSLGLKGVRWWVFLRPLGVRSIALAMRATVGGAALNNLVVAQGGEGARVLAVSRASGVSSARILSALAMDRALDMVTYLVLLVGAVSLLDVPPLVARWRTWGLVGLALALVLMAIVAAAGRGPALEIMPARGHRGHRLSVMGRIRAYMGRFGRGIADVASPGRLIVAMILSLGAWALQLATYHLTARAAHIPLAVTGSLTALLAVGISFLIRATPGNVGVFQLAYALAVRPFGVQQGAAVAVALLIQTLQVIPTLIAGVMASPRLFSGTRDAGRKGDKGPADA